MEGKLSSLNRAQLIEGPSGPRGSIPGRLGVFDYSGAGEPGSLCLFAPDDPAQLGGKAKLRPSPGTVQLEGKILRFTIRESGKAYAWELGEAMADERQAEAFLDFASANDRIIRHLLEGSALLS
ncbi:MAG: hypothetical protein J6S36_06920 [Eggerthellaceae bacterium]|nr:hypothetical protein [Eggerthellaceae bacterium]